MDVLGLLVGIPGFFTSCIEIVERIDAYKDFGVDSPVTVARFEAEKLRLKKWSDQMGIRDGSLLDDHDPRLDDPEHRSVVAKILCGVCQILEVTEPMDSRLRALFEISGQSNASISKEFAEPRRSTRNVKIRKQGIVWSLRSKARFQTQVENMNKAVSTLYELIPPSERPQKQCNSSSSDEPGLMRRR